MVDLPLPRTSLASLDLASRTATAAEGGGVSLGQRPFLGKIALRGDAGEQGFIAAVRRVTHADLPSRPGETFADEALAILCLAPDEWLLVCGSFAEADELRRNLSIALEAQHAAATDLSSGSTVLRLGGVASKPVLQKGCSLDLDAPHFVPGRCARTRLGNADVVLHQVEDGSDPEAATYDIYVPRSYAVSLVRWLEDASAEYGLTVTLV